MSSFPFYFSLHFCINVPFFGNSSSFCSLLLLTFPLFCIHFPSLFFHSQIFVCTSAFFFSFYFLSRAHIFPFIFYYSFLFSLPLPTEIFSHFHLLFLFVIKTLISPHNFRACLNDPHNVWYFPFERSSQIFPAWKNCRPWVWFLILSDVRAHAHTAIGCKQGR